MSECRPPAGTLPDTNHILTGGPDDAWERWAHWSGTGWDGLVWNMRGAPVEERRHTSPKFAYDVGYRYKAPMGALQVTVKGE